MRRTKVAQIYKKTGNLRAVQLLLGYTKMDSTVRHLGVDQATPGRFGPAGHVAKIDIFLTSRGMSRKATT